MTPPPSEPDYIFFRVDRTQLMGITFIESCGDDIVIHQLNKRSLMSLQTLSQIKARLVDKSFVQGHRSYIVSLAKVDPVDTVDTDHLLIGDTDVAINDALSCGDDT
ncbi:LytTR family transcriptional regulator DNA-binding domain-containing protein [Pseudoalteromonas sp. H105]|uniref:LytTR family transcriptional regulator DNA-binding domain-containing protein n=1 Tax=Pseudoalteromonas sp. H105 TaxID=1348393 RepID=UPI0009EC0C3C|nr:LytTR family DNA-binding domain-containing protein [Pseudoalteromonas sp. H105]